MRVAERWATQNRDFRGVGIRAQHGSIRSVTNLRNGCSKPHYFMRNTSFILFPSLPHTCIMGTLPMLVDIPSYPSAPISLSSCFSHKHCFVINTTLYNSPRSYTPIEPKSTDAMAEQTKLHSLQENAMILKTDKAIHLRSHEVRFPLLCFRIGMSCVQGTLSSRDGSRLRIGLLVLRGTRGCNAKWAKASLWFNKEANMSSSSKPKFTAT